MSAKAIRYSCAKCGATVHVAEDGDIDRPCKCDASILADLSATCRGEAAVATGKRA
jgi:DNA-directed RNA polymerase subunit RPC12/RpoP